MPVHLRGHHFLCVLTYRGYGYTLPFVANMTALVEAIAAGRPVKLIEGPDDICNGLTAECRAVCDHDCADPSTREIDRLAVEAVGAFLPLQDGTPFVLTGERVNDLRAHFKTGALRSACTRCPWNEFCTEIAAEGFAGVRLFEPQGA